MSLRQYIGGPRKVDVLTSGTSITSPPWATAVRISGTARGGAGGNGSAGALGGGGGAGEWVEGLVVPVSGNTAYSYVIGGVGADTSITIAGCTYRLRPGAAGSAAGAGNGNGGNGGGGINGADDGNPGSGGGTTNFAQLGYRAFPFNGGTGGGAAGMFQLVPGPGARATNNSGGTSPFGVPGLGAVGAGAGGAATGYGAGGGGGGTGSGAGGAGAPALLILEWIA